MKELPQHSTASNTLAYSADEEDRAGDTHRAADRYSLFDRACRIRLGMDRDARIERGDTGGQLARGERTRRIGGCGDD